MQYPCFTLVRVLYDLKDYEQALKYYDKTIELYEEYAQAYINRGNTKIDLKMIEEAIEDLNKALKIDKTIMEQSIRDFVMKIFICLKKL
ncbi:tetratricopeptide repeat protein [Campylobacter lari]|nr:tetratricopeptide repeat protein [Campylobacter lari]